MQPCFKITCKLGLEKQQSMLLAEKSEEITNLKSKVQELEHENADLKKKYLLRLMTQN